jgi:hypothetical protein
MKKVIKNMTRIAGLLLLLACPLLLAQSSGEAPADADLMISAQVHGDIYG